MELISTAEAAVMLSVTQAAILKFIKEGRLQAQESFWGTRPVWRIDPNELSNIKVFNQGRPAGTTPLNPSGTCQCGCGQQTEVATHSSARRNTYKGEYARFVKGHNGSALSVSPYIVDETSGCWVWQRHLNKDGYPTISTIRSKSTKAHRVFYEDKFGPIPHGLEIDHLCKNRACVNPDHLEVVSHAENNRRASTAKINPQIAAEMRRLRTEDNLTYDEIATIYSVNRHLSWRVCTGRSWVP